MASTSTAAEPNWLTIKEAAYFYDISVSSVNRWILKNPDLFQTKHEDGQRYVDTANSKPPPNARLKNVNIPEGYLTLEQAQEYYKLSRTAVHCWIRDGHLATEIIANIKYVIVPRSNPPNTRHEPAEDWKAIPGFAGYEASRDGRIRNVKTYNVLKPNTVQGYHQVMLYRDGAKVPCSVHRLVAHTYIPNPENKRTVNHKNHNPTDNHAENLEWHTPAEQNRHKRSTFKQREVPDQMDQEGETWKPTSVEGFYISNHGRLCNRDYVVMNLNTDYRYIEVKVTLNKRLYIHREVARAFLPNFKEGMVVNHKDGNAHNNHVDNLEVVTQSENVLHGYEIGKCKNRVAVIQKLPDGTTVRYKSITEAAEKTGLKKDSIGYASKHNTRLGGYEWSRE